MPTLRRLSVVAVAIALLAAIARADRTFDLTYAGSVTGLPPGRTVRVWLPVPSDSAAQQVQPLSRDIPAKAVVQTDAHGNVICSFDAVVPADGTVRFSTAYRVTRRATDGQPLAPGEDLAAALRPDRLVPTDGRPLAFLTGKKLPADDMAKARVLYDTVYDTLTYGKDKPGWGNGDVLWACDSRSGNCSDFHSLFLSLARASGLPAKMEFGLTVPSPDKPPAIAGYHCWAFFKAAENTGWTPVDITNAKNHPEKKDLYFGHLDADRVTLSTGRDLTLVPPQAGPPLNFFVYPYAEVGGRPVPAGQITRDFAAANTPATQPVH